MPTRISSGGVLLPPNRVRSQSAATAEVIRSLAGRAAELYELATGEPCLADHPPVTPKNPQGLTGWDWSGPPWGSAVLHPVAWMSTADASTNVHAPDVTDQTERVFSGNGTNVARVAHISMRLWCRPHDLLPSPYVAPYSRVTVALRAHRLTGGATPVATCKVWNNALQTVDQAASQTFTTGVTETTHQFGNTLKVPVQSGWNVVQLELTTTGATSHYVDSVLLYNSVKRSH
jgi:hypothetical protein